MTTTTQPAVTKRIAYSREDRDYSCYVAIDGGPEEYIGSAPTYHDGELMCDEYAIERYSKSTPEVAARLTMEAVATEQRHAQAAADQGLEWGDESSITTQLLDAFLHKHGSIRLCVGGPDEPAPPVDDDVEDNFGGFRGPIEPILRGAHHPQNCPAIGARLMGEEEPTSPHCWCLVWREQGRTGKCPACQTNAGLLPGFPICDKCDRAGLARLKAAVFQDEQDEENKRPPHACPSCGDQVARSELLSVCEEINAWLGSGDGANALPFEPPWYQAFHRAIARASLCPACREVGERVEGAPSLNQRVLWAV